MAVWPAFTVAEVELPAAAPKDKSSGAFMVSVRAVEVLPVKFVSPEYFAVIECVPADSDEVLNVPCTFAPSAPVPICVLPSKNATTPVGVMLTALETAAVNVTCWPAVTVVAEAVSAVEVAACWIV